MIDIIAYRQMIQSFFLVQSQVSQVSQVFMVNPHDIPCFNVSTISRPVLMEDRRSWHRGLGPNFGSCVPKLRAHELPKIDMTSTHCYVIVQYDVFIHTVYIVTYVVQAKTILL